MVEAALSIPTGEIEIGRQVIGNRVELFLSQIPQNGVVVIGDTHLFTLDIGSFKVGPFHVGPFNLSNKGEKAVLYLEKIFTAIHPAIIVLLGDIIDLYVQPALETTLAECSAMFEYLEGRINDPENPLSHVVYISGNHDRGILKELEERFRFLTLGHELRIGDIVRLIHWGDTGVSPIGVESQEEIKRSLTSRNIFKRVLLTLYTKIPLTGLVSVVGNNVIGEWINRWNFIPERLKAVLIPTNAQMLEYAQQLLVQLLITGHTHRAEQLGEFANPGSFAPVPGMKDIFTALHLDRNGVVRIFDCVKGRETTVEEIYASRIASLMRVVGKIIERAKVIV